MKSKNIVTFFMTISLVSCLPGYSQVSTKTVEPTKTLLTSSVTKTSIPTFTTTPTETPIPSEFVPEFSFNDLAENANYLRDCKDLYPPHDSQQVGYQNIYPHKTRSEQVTQIYGPPREYPGIPIKLEWVIDNPELNLFYEILASKNIVTDVFVTLDKDLLTPFQGFLNRFGCPDLIVAVELDAQSLSAHNYNTTFMIYHQLGFEVRFEGFPISYLSPATVVTFSKPRTLEEYLRTDYDWVGEAASPVTLTEVIGYP